MISLQFFRLSSFSRIKHITTEIQTTRKVIVVKSIALATPKFSTISADNAGAIVLPMVPQVSKNVTRIAGAFFICWEPTDIPNL